MKIAIDIGHCSTGDQGAVSQNGIAEHPWWYAHYDIISRELTLLGHKVRMFRREDYSRSVANECKAINAWGANVAISLHLNSSDSAACKGGHEMVHYDGSISGKALACALDARFDQIEGLADRNTRTPYQGRGDTFLSKTICPAVIVEGAFLSVQNDVKVIESKGHEIALAIAQGIHDYCKSITNDP